VTNITMATAGHHGPLLDLLVAADLHDDLGTHPDTTAFIAEQSGEVVGGAALEVYGDSGLLRSLVVAPHRRGGGLGRELVERVVAEARDRGLEDLSLLTLTVPGFFERLGFVRIDKATAPAAVQASHEFAVLCPDSAVAMTRRI
jgi:amino-acid N-acetyltransferase